MLHSSVPGPQLPVSFLKSPATYLTSKCTCLLALDCIIDIWKGYVTFSTTSSNALQTAWVLSRLGGNIFEGYAIAGTVSGRSLLTY